MRSLSDLDDIAANQKLMDVIQSNAARSIAVLEKVLSGESEGNYVSLRPTPVQDQIPAKRPKQANAIAKS